MDKKNTAEKFTKGQKVSWLVSSPGLRGHRLTGTVLLCRDDASRVVVVSDQTGLRYIKSRRELTAIHCRNCGGAGYCTWNDTDYVECPRCNGTGTIITRTPNNG